jgi:hypothetical protein
MIGFVRRQLEYVELVSNTSLFNDVTDNELQQVNSARI